MTLEILRGPAPQMSAPARELRVTRRLAGGPYGWLTPHIARMSAANPSVAARALALPRDETHFIALALALLREEARTDDMVDALGRAIGRDRREMILATFAPAVDPRLARYCAKIAGRPWRARTYLKLAALHAEPHARKVLAHASAITRRSVLMLWRLPAPLRREGVLNMIERPSDLAKVLFAVEIVRRVRTDLTERQIIASLEKADSGYVRDWVEAHYDRVPFASAPVGISTDGRGGVLRPISTGGDLRRAGRDYDNCVRDHVLEAFAGAAAFYRYEVRERRVAVVELRPCPGIGWAISQVKGPHNDELVGEDRRFLIEMLAGAGVAATPQAHSPYARGFRLS